MKQFHVARAACVAPMIAALTDAGAPVDRLLAQSGLHRFRVHDLNAHVPAKCVHNFFEIVARRETGPSLPREITSHYVLANMGGFGAEVLASSDLRAAFLLLASQPDARKLSYETVALDVRGVRSELSDYLAIPPSLARSWLEHLTVCLAMNTFRAAAGADWTPAELHVTNGACDSMAEFLSDKTVVRRNASTPAVVFPTEVLARPMRRNSPATDDIGPGPRLRQTMATKIEAVLDASNNDLTPTLEGLAVLSDLPPRSFQRRLSNEGTTFFEVVDRWRFTRALKLISNPDVTIGEIAESLRYSHASHFTRAFKRWTGVTPNSFRDSPLVPS